MMHTVSRREFCGKAAMSIAAAGFLSASERRVFANPLGLPIGSQVYPHRQRIQDGDFAGLCKDMAAIGIGSVELDSPDYPYAASLSNGKQVKKILDDHGLKSVSTHTTLEGLRTRQQEMIAWAHDIGITQIGSASLQGQMQNGVTTMDAVKRAADEYNKLAAVSAAGGLQQYLHDEDFEMSKVEGDGRVTYAVLLELLDPKLVKMQFQMSAMRVVGDPVMYFNKYPGRFISMHLQGVDLNAPMPGPRIPGAPRQATPQVAVGHDSLDWPKIFEAAKVGGVKNYYVEQNWDLTVQSVAYLKTLKV
jgi:sugar phosphate isomerase/epimerase